MVALSEEIAAYEAMQLDLEASHLGQWLVMKDRQVAGIYGSFEVAAAKAVEMFGRGPYLIRQIGAPAVTLPASVMYPLNAPIELRF